MSTATLPDVVEGEELERLLRDDPELAKLVNSDKAIPCTILRRNHKECGRPSKWIIHVTFACECLRAPTTRTVCAECMEKHQAQVAPFGCSRCGRPVIVRFIELL